MGLQGAQAGKGVKEPSRLYSGPARQTTPQCSGLSITMSTQLIYSVKRIFTAGRELPNWRLSVLTGIPGRIVIKSEAHNGLDLRSRDTLCATLLHPTNGHPVPEVPKMYDARVLSLTGDELIVSGIECPDELVKTHYAQCWIATPIELAILPEWSPG